MQLEDTRVFLKEAVALKEVYEMVYIVANGDRAYEKEGVGIIGIPKTNKKVSLDGLKKIWTTYKVADALKCEVYQVHEPELILFGVWQKLKGHKVVYDQHEFDYVSGKGVLRGMLRWIFKFSEKAAYIMFDGTICATDGIKESVWGRAVVVANYVDASTINTKETRKNKVFTVVYAGGVSESRGLYNLIDAVSEISMSGKKIKLLLMGRASERFDMEKLRAPEVEYLGHVPQEALYANLAKAHIGYCVLPKTNNYLEGWATKILEYMSVGLPVMGSDFPKWRDFYGDSIYYCHPTTREIAKAILELKNKDLQERLRAKGKDFASTHRWETERKKLIEFHRDLGGKKW